MPNLKHCPALKTRIRILYSQGTNQNLREKKKRIFVIKRTVDLHKMRRKQKKRD